MRTRLLTALGAVTLLVAASVGFLAATAPSAGAAWITHNTTLQTSPARGGPGTVISASGACNLVYAPPNMLPAPGSGATHAFVVLEQDGYFIAGVDVPVVPNGTGNGQDTWSASLTVPPGANGADTVTAQCLRPDNTSSGDLPYYPADFFVTGTQHATVTLSAAPQPAATNSPVTISATVTAAGGPPTGAVDFSIDGADAGTVTLNGDGVATITPSRNAPAVITVAAHYLGDATYAAADASPLEVRWGPQPQATTVTLRGSPNPAVGVSDATVTATVTGGEDTPTGTVTFTVDGAAQPPVALTDGRATLPVHATPPASLTIAAHYSGDVDHTASDAAPFTQRFVPNITTATSLELTPPVAMFGRTVTLSGTVTDTDADHPGVTPIGTIAITEGARVVARATTIAGADGTATYTATASGLPVGAHELVATYTPVNAYAPGVSTASARLVVTPSATVALTSSANPAAPGQAVTFTAAVSPLAPATGPVTGYVAFIVDGAWRAVVPLDAAGRASSGPLTGLADGEHLVGAVYFGDGAGLSTATAYLFQSVARAPSTLTADPILSSYPNLRATLSSGGAPLMGATVTFTTPGGAAICTGTTDATGTATCPGGLQALVAFGYRASFAGDGGHGPAAASAGW